MKIAAYCRFSSDRQQETSIRDQLRNIENYCQRQGWSAPVLYQDQAISGSRNDRPGYRDLLHAAELKAFEVLLVDDLSRLSRDHIESAQTIRMLKYAGIRVIGVSDGTDTARDSYKLETGLRGLMSEFYLDDLAKKTHRGLMGQALDGYSAGGLPYGYDSHHDGKGYRRSINLEEAEWVRFIFQRYASGRSARQIAAELNELAVPSPRGGTWAHSAIYPDAKGVGILGNQIYNGKHVWNKTAWVKDPHTGRRRRTMRPKSEWVTVDAPDLVIIDNDLWRACQLRYQEIRRKTAKTHASGGGKPKYLFSGLLKCGVCGGSYVMLGKNHYGCGTHRNRGNTVCNNAKMIKKTTVEQVLLAEIKESLLSEECYKLYVQEVSEMLQSERPDPKEARKRLQAAQKNLDNIMAAIKAGIVTSSTKTALLEAENKMEDAKRELEAVSSYEPGRILPRAKEIYRDMVLRLEAIEAVDEAREILRSLLGEIQLVPEQEALTAVFNGQGLSESMRTALVAGTGFEPVTFGL